MKMSYLSMIVILLAYLLKGSVARSNEPSIKVFSKCKVTWSTGNTHWLTSQITFVSDNTILGWPQFIAYKPAPESEASVGNIIGKFENNVCSYHYSWQGESQEIQAIVNCTLIKYAKTR